MSLGYIPGHKVRLQYLLSILIEKQVLGRQVHLRVCTSIIRPVMAGGCLFAYVVNKLIVTTLSPASSILISSSVSAA